MSTEGTLNAGQPVAPVHELGHLRPHWWFFLIIGVLLVLGGTIAIVFPMFSSIAFVGVLAAILMIAGVATIIASFWAGKWSGFLVHLLVGLLYLAASLIITERPLMSIVLMTLFVAVAFMVIGLFRTLAAMIIRFPQWGWALLSGVVTFMAGLVIFRALEGGAVAALWVLGLLVGLEMLFNGWTYIMLSLAIRRIAQALRP